MAASELASASIHGSCILTAPAAILASSLPRASRRRCWIVLPESRLPGGLTLPCRPQRVLQRRRFSVAQKPPQMAEEQDELDGEMTEQEESNNEPRDQVQETSPPGIHTLINAYKEAISSNDTSKVVTIESQLVALQEERDALGRQVVVLTEDLSTRKERLLRLNADFDNFRKRSERDKLAMTETVRGDIIESLLPMVDNFERAKAQIKVETEAEQRIDSSYQGIYKQFVEIMRGFGVSVVQTIGQVFDPSQHEAITQEESTDYKEGVVVQEFRKGFLLNGRLLRPAMVKVSTGPGNVKPSISGSAEAPSHTIVPDASEVPSQRLADISEKAQNHAADVAEYEAEPVS